MKKARDFEDLDSIDTELNRLRSLVEDAFNEGWCHRDTYEQASSKVKNTLGWNNSESKKSLDK